MSELTDPRAPHETAAVLRLHRAGWPAPKICGLLKISKDQLVHELNRAIDDETQAGLAKLPIHDATYDPAYKPAEKNAKEIKPGDTLTDHGSYVVNVWASAAIVTFRLATGEHVRYAPFDKVKVTPAKEA